MKSIKRQLLTTVDGWLFIGCMLFVVGCVGYAIVKFWP